MFINKLLIASAVCALACIPASAVVLTFSDLGLANYGDIPGTYGDRVTALNDGVGSYAEGNGFTPNVTVEYRTWSINPNAVAYDHLDWWNTNYGDLSGVAFGVSSSNYYAEVSLIADAGFEVRLNSFDLGGYALSDHPNSTVRVVDASRNLLLDYSPVNIEGNAGHSTFSPGLSGQVVRIQYGFNDWNVGIDNIDFDQLEAAAVPEPSTFVLGAGGMAALALARRRYQR